jgi:hypothetical protein
LLLSGARWPLGLQRFGANWHEDFKPEES